MAKEKLAVLSLTKGGFQTAKKINELFPESTHFTMGANNDGSAVEMPHKLFKFLPEIFNKYETLVFVMATGIVIRGIAPLIKDKKTDPGVVVLDEKGNYAISLLSGHLGGANEATHEIANRLGAQAVITTSSDVNNKVAVDMIAKNNGMAISDMEACKDITALLVNSKPVAIVGDIPLGKRPPYYQDSIEGAQGAVVISNKANARCEIPFVQLIPRNIIIGAGCRRGTSPEEMKSFVLEELGKLELNLNSIKTVASIDIKSDEAAIIKLAETLNAEKVFFTSEELNEVSHLFKASDFVKSITGTTSVSEASAYLAGNRKGKMLLAKKARTGMTLSIFMTEHREIVI